jgi:hypothetical protein
LRPRVSPPGTGCQKCVAARARGRGRRRPCRAGPGCEEAGERRQGEPLAGRAAVAALPPRPCGARAPPGPTPATLHTHPSPVPLAPRRRRNPTGLTLATTVTISPGQQYICPTTSGPSQSLQNVAFAPPDRFGKPPGRSGCRPVTDIHGKKAEHAGRALLSMQCNAMQCRVQTTAIPSPPPPLLPPSAPVTRAIA